MRYKWCNAGSFYDTTGVTIICDLNWSLNWKLIDTLHVTLFENLLLRKWRIVKNFLKKIGIWSRSCLDLAQNSALLRSDVMFEPSVICSVFDQRVKKSKIRGQRVRGGATWILSILQLHSQEWSIFSSRTSPSLDSYVVLTRNYKLRAELLDSIVMAALCYENETKTLKKAIELHLNTTQAPIERNRDWDSWNANLAIVGVVQYVMLEREER